MDDFFEQKMAYDLAQQKPTCKGNAGRLMLEALASANGLEVFLLAVQLMSSDKLDAAAACNRAARELDVKWWVQQ